MTEFIEQTFEGVGNKIKLEKGEYESCHFIDCIFTGEKLSHFSFTECTFERCELSSIVNENTSFKEIKFIDCKMLGVQFENSNPFLFEVEFHNCQLNLSSFYQVNLKKTTFYNCNLSEVDFTESNLDSAKLIECDLSLAIFERTNLSSSDIRTSFNFIIDPTKNNVAKAKFSKQGALGLLSKFNIVID